MLIKRMHFNFLVLIFSSVLLFACAAPSKTGSTYSQPDMGRVATVMSGTVLGIREVNISGTSSVGSAAGAGVGAVAGSTAGDSIEASIAGAIVGAVAGAVAGGAAEGAATKGTASEFIIKQENGQTIAIVQTNEDNIQVGDKVLILRSGTTKVVKDYTKQ